jgi:hypothetical protein
MDEKPKGKPGPKPVHGETLTSHTLKTTEAQWAKVQANGGTAWLRKLIEKAKGKAS